LDGEVIDKENELKRLEKIREKITSEQDNREKWEKSGKLYKHRPNKEFRNGCGYCFNDNEFIELNVENLRNHLTKILDKIDCLCKGYSDIFESSQLNTLEKCYTKETIQKLLDIKAIQDANNK